MGSGQGPRRGGAVASAVAAPAFPSRPLLRSVGPALPGWAPVQVRYRVGTGLGRFGSVARRKGHGPNTQWTEFKVGWWRDRLVRATTGAPGVTGTTLPCRNAGLGGRLRGQSR